MLLTSPTVPLPPNVVPASSPTAPTVPSTSRVVPLPTTVVRPVYVLLPERAT